MIGSLVAGRYRIEKRIGGGGQSQVWLARDLSDNARQVALKQIPSEFRGRALREVEVLTRIEHPGIVRIYDHHDLPDGLWIVMQYIKSSSLGDLIAARGALPEREVARIGLEVLGALTVAHRNHVLHRDVKPSNILISEAGEVVLVDFGIAAVKGAVGLTATHQVIGTVGYMAPERLLGRPADVRSDLWSLGATLYMAAEDRPPFGRAGSLSSVDEVLGKSPDTPTRLRLLWPIVSRLLREDPAERPSAAELERALRAIAEGQPIQPRRQPPVVRPPAPSLSPRRGSNSAIKHRVRRALTEVGPTAAAPMVLDLPPVDAIFLLRDLLEQRPLEAYAIVSRMCDEPQTTAKILGMTTAPLAGRLLTGVLDYRAVAEVMLAMDPVKAGRALGGLPVRLGAAVLAALAELCPNEPAPNDQSSDELTLVAHIPRVTAAAMLKHVPQSLRARIQRLLA